MEGNAPSLPKRRTTFRIEMATTARCPPKMEFKSRTRPARQPLFANGKRPPILFVTVCTEKRKSILIQPKIHEHLVEAWHSADRWLVGRYIIMPDHIHLFCSPATIEHRNVKKWIQFWKSLASRTWPYPENQPLWQTDGWDTQLRQGNSYSAKWEYVRQNPTRAGLVETAEDWPYHGELNKLFWQE